MSKPIVNTNDYLLLKTENAKLKEKIADLELQIKEMKSAVFDTKSTPLDVAKDCEFMCQTDLWGKGDIIELAKHLLAMADNME